MDVYNWLTWLVSFLPSSPETTGCANQTQLDERKSLVFFCNVLFNFAIFVLATGFQAEALRRLWKKSPFSRSTSFLIQAIIVIGFIHNVIYEIIQIWSLYRAHENHDEPCKIMFTEHECFPLYSLNIMIRLIMILTIDALAINECMKILKWGMGTVSEGLVMMLIAIIISFVLTLRLISDGPNTNLMHTCLSRTGRDAHDLFLQVFHYTSGLVFCICLAGFLAYDDYLQKRSISSPLQRKLKRGLTLTIVVVSCLMLVYSSSVAVILQFMELSVAKTMGNVILWFYTFPHATLVFPFMLLRFLRTNKTRAMLVQSVHSKVDEMDKAFKAAQSQRVKPQPAVPQPAIPQPAEPQPANTQPVESQLEISEAESDQEPRAPWKPPSLPENMTETQVHFDELARSWNDYDKGNQPINMPNQRRGRQSFAMTPVE